MEHGNSHGQELPTLTIKNSKSQRHPCKNSYNRSSVLTIGREAYNQSNYGTSEFDQNNGDLAETSDGQFDDSEDDLEAFRHEVRARKDDDSSHKSALKKYEEKSTFFMHQKFDDTDDDLEAFRFEVKANANEVVTPIENKVGKCTLSVKAEGDTSVLSAEKESAMQSTYDTVNKSPESSQKERCEFFPVNVITSAIPEMYDEKFPKPINQSGKFVCVWCKPKTRLDVNKAIYKSVYNLVKHYLLNHKDIPLKDYGIQCEHCFAFFFHERRLELHLSGSNCPKLNKLRHTGLQVGRKLTADTIMKRCPFCDRIFLSEKRYQKHFISDGNGCKFAHLDECVMEWGDFDYVKCKFCAQTFLFEIEYQQHMTPWNNGPTLSKTMGIFKCRNVSPLYFECSVCMGLFNCETTFIQHIYHDHTIEEFQFSCDRCKKPFRLRNNYEDHVNAMSKYASCIDYDSCRTIPIKADNESCSYRERGLTLHKCPNCSSVHGTKSDLIYHMKKDHDIAPQWKCDDCKMTFITLNDYEDHVTKWKCPFCLDPQVFSLKRLLDDHCWTTHRIKDTSEESKVCSICRKVLENDFTLQAHMREFHPENDLKTCPFCGESDDNRINMYKHIKTFHAYQIPEEKIFSCELCKASFVNKHKLARHIACVHKKGETTECDICHKTFAQKATMMRHRRIHLDIKPFKCGICELSFTQKTGMRAHRARHYNKDGTLKSAEEIKIQVEIIKEQRNKQADPKSSSENKGKSRKKNRKKSVTCERCGLKCTSNVDYDSHVCETGDGIDSERTAQPNLVSGTKQRRGRSKSKKKLVCETCGDHFSNKAEFDSHTCASDEVSDDSNEYEDNSTKSKDSQDDMLEYNFKCDKCLKDFVSERRFTTHRCLDNYRKVLTRTSC